jgi:hypothetical protein
MWWRNKKCYQNHLQNPDARKTHDFEQHGRTIQTNDKRAGRTQDKGSRRAEGWRRDRATPKLSFSLSQRLEHCLSGRFQQDLTERHALEDSNWQEKM